MPRATASAKVKTAAKKSAAVVAAKKTAAAVPPKSAKGQGKSQKLAVTPKKAAAKGKIPAAKPASARKGAPQKAAPVKKAASVKKATSAKKAGPVKQAAAANIAARTVAVKKAAPRRPATRTAVTVPAVRRGRPSASPRSAPRKLQGGAAQSFTVSHLNEGDFRADGLRSYARYRDLGIAAATGGLCQAHVIRLVPPCTDDVRKRHLHKTELQLVYVLKGWMKNEFEGVGEQMMSVGSCWLQPTGIKHTVLDYSPDCEVLEIIVPADFKTEDAT